MCALSILEKYIQVVRIYVVHISLRDGDTHCRLFLGQSALGRDQHERRPVRMLADFHEILLQRFDLILRQLHAFYAVPVIPMRSHFPPRLTRTPFIILPL